MEHEWDAVEFDKDTTPWAAVILGTLVFGAVAIYFFTADNYFGAALFVLLPVILISTLRREPRTMRAHINSKGVSLNRELYKFKAIRYFVLQDGHLIIKPRKQNAVYIPIIEGDDEVIRNILQGHGITEEEEYEESITELINRVLHLK